MKAPVTWVELWACAPLVVGGVTALAVLLTEAFSPPERRKAVNYWITVVGLLVVLLLGLAQANGAPAFGSMYRNDALGYWLNLAIVASALLTVLMSQSSLAPVHTGEYYGLLVISTLGGMITVNAGNLIMIFLGLELLTIPLYILVGYRRQELASAEAGLKYFLLGAFSSAFTLYGAALLYGAGGTMNLADLAGVELRTAHPAALLLGTGLILAGIGFKIALVPFHFWVPDVYTGAPTPITAYLASVSKVAGFGAFIRVLSIGLSPLQSRWAPALWLLVAATLLLGSIGALVQSNIKRLLAYSSIVHGGYVVLCLLNPGPAGVRGAVFYLFVYSFMSVGAFAVVHLLEQRDPRFLTISEYAGLGEQQPLAAGMLALFLLGLTGIPLTAGFAGKFFIFYNAAHAGYFWLLGIALLAAVISAYYYLRIVVLMYMREAPAAVEVRLTPAYQTVLWGCSAVVIFLGVWPTPVLEWMERISGVITR